MYTLLVVLAVIVAILLILIVLVQDPKGGGLTAGQSQASAIMGVRKTADFLEKATWTLVGLLAVLVIASSAFLPKQSVSATNNVTDIVEQNVPATEAPAADMPAAEAE